MASCSADETQVSQAERVEPTAKMIERGNINRICSASDEIYSYECFTVLNRLPDQSINQQWSYQMPTTLLYFIFSKDICVQQRTEVTPDALEISMLDSLTCTASYHHSTIPRMRTVDDQHFQKNSKILRVWWLLLIIDRIETNQGNESRISSMSTLEGFPSPSYIASWQLTRPS
jgi:hypothetical protein